MSTFGGNALSGSAFQGPSFSGVSVDQFSALSATAIYNAVTLISSSLALMDLYVAEKLPGDSIRIATDHPTYDLVHSASNDHMTAYISRQTVLGHTCLGGNGIWEIERTKKGRPKAFHVLEPANVKTELEPRDGPAQLSPRAREQRPPAEGRRPLQDVGLRRDQRVPARSGP